MTRHEVEHWYKVEDGRIASPGKFEGEPAWAPSFWDAALNGFADDDDGVRFAFWPDPADRREWPELAGVAKVLLWQDEQGFVHSDTVTND